MSTRVELRRGIYRDSVVLMQVSQDVAACKGVAAAIVAMATPLNLEIYERLGFDPAAVEEASPNDLLVAIRADDGALDTAVAELERRLAPSASPQSHGFGIGSRPSDSRLRPSPRWLPGPHLGAGSRTPSWKQWTPFRRASR